MSLRISLTVRRCLPPRTGDRVRFQLGDRCVPGEKVVLKRWQQRSNEPHAVRSDTRFDGCRLPPGTWRMVQACLASGMTDDDLRDAAKLSTAISTIREHHPTWRAPTAGKLANVLEFLMARGVLERVISITPDERSPGIPDLFLYRWSPSRRVHAGCFVEVKRTVRRTAYREPLLRAQKIAHDCLKSLGLVVHVVYLIE